MGIYEEYQKVNRQLIAHKYNGYRDVVIAMVDCYHKYIKPIDTGENGNLGIMVFLSIIRNKCEAANIRGSKCLRIAEILEGMIYEPIRLQRYIFLSLGYTFKMDENCVIINKTNIYSYKLVDDKPVLTLVRKDGKKC